MRIKDIMSHPLVTVPDTSTLDAAARLMWEYDCGVIPVLNDEGRIKGVITDRDICMAAYTQGRPLAEIAVTSAMATDVVTCRAGDDLELVEHLMGDHQIRRVPVLDAENRPVGIVSMNDIARKVSTSRKGALDRELVAAIAAICEPHAEVASARPNNVIAQA
jgi:CBS domain-containing protein